MGREIASAKIDVVFKALFIRKEELLKNFISDVLDIPFENSIDQSRNTIRFFGRQTGKT